MDVEESPAMITPSQGVHIVLDRSFLPGESALMVPKTDDGRLLFMIPWQGKVLVGTTDTPCDVSTLDPVPLPEEIDYLLDHASRYLTNRPLTADVRSMFAGIRPLAKASPRDRPGKTSSVSRDHVLRISKSELITITGGKWTTYRRMAEDTVNEAARVAGLPGRPCETGALSLGSDHHPETPDGRQDEQLDPRLPCGRADVVRAVSEEMARTVEDVLSRRTRCLLLDAEPSMEIARQVADIMAAELGRGSEWIEAEITSFHDLAASYLPERRARRDIGNG
jgi:glycerol-3-phosphate dehydrogenase